MFEKEVLKYSLVEALVFKHAVAMSEIDVLSFSCKPLMSFVFFSLFVVNTYKAFAMNIAVGKLYKGVLEMINTSEVEAMISTSCTICKGADGPIYPGTFCVVLVECYMGI